MFMRAQYIDQREITFREKDALKEIHNMFGNG